MNQDAASSQGKTKKSAPAKTAPGAKTTTDLTVPKPPLFRRIDWMAFGLCTVLVFIGYFLTLAPDLTLEDSGELATGSYYAAVPHPPGYPVWTLYSWLFTVLVPVSNVAWRVALSSAVAGAFSCGLIALVVSRGSSMMIESIESLKSIERKVENWVCLIAGCISGLLMGFNGYMWSQSIIVEVYSLSVLSLMGVIALQMRWLYEPEKRRYLYIGMFLFGICLTNHMSLLVAAMGIEIAILAVQPRLGRDLFLGNSIIYVLALIIKAKSGISSLDGNTPLFVGFNLIGLSSMVACGWLTIKTGKIGTEWKSVLIMALMWGLGAIFYFYMPLASMTNPPMNWGYPRTAEGFVHALKRGQYESVKPTTDPWRYLQQLSDVYVTGAEDEYNYVYLLIGLTPFVFYRLMQKRERAWLIGLSGIFLFLSLFLLWLLNPGFDRQSKDLHRVFFTASHVIIAIAIGYGVTLLSSFLITQYEKARRFAVYGAAVAVALAVYTLASVIAEGFTDMKDLGAFKQFTYGLNKAIAEGQVYWPVHSALFLLGLTTAFLVIFLVCRRTVKTGLLLGLFALLPIHSIMSHWYDNEQRGHLFGFWFGHDMFTPPFGIYPEMTKDAILYGGTDPGRFCPTYMIFCESFIKAEKRRDPKFDRRDVYIITQNALADGTYLNYIRAHYNRSTQIDPPFFQNFFKTPGLAFLDRIFTDIGAKIEKRRRADGVYPLKEMYIATPDDSQRSFNEYLTDADQRSRVGKLKPGEEFRNDNGRISVSGQVAVMAINGLLTKVMFDKNPDHEFFVEESFPLDWMYPHLTPFGVIMKINREPVVEMAQDVVDKDHKFWTQYSDRLIGNWITYETPVTNVCAFAERVYLRQDFRDFKGDRKFARDDNAQKAFSKLRSSIGGLYAWRGSAQNSRNPVEQQRMIKEADFAFKQSFAFCPYSPEAVFRYVNLLLSLGRMDDAIAIVATCKKLDADNTQVDGLLRDLKNLKTGGNTQGGQLDLQTAFNEVRAFIDKKQNDKAIQKLDQIMAQPTSDGNVALTAARFFVEIGDVPRFEAALIKLTTLSPDNPEAWFDLAGVQAVMSKNAEAMESLKKCVALNQARLARDPKALDLMKNVMNDQRFVNLRQLPQFKQVTGAP